MSNPLCELCYDDDNEMENVDIIVDSDNNTIGYIFYCSDCRIETEVYID